MRPASMTATRSAIDADHLHLVGDQQDGQAEPAVDVLQQAPGSSVSSPGRAPRSLRRTAAAPGARPAPWRCRHAASGRPTARPDRLSPSPTGRRDPAARRHAPGARPWGEPSIFSGSATLSSTVLADSRLKCWKIMPMRRRSGCSSRSPRPVISRPSMKTAPESGRSSPFRQRISVDLPAPLRPMMPRISPLRTVSETPSSAGVAPKRRFRSVRRTTSSEAVAIGRDPPLQL